MTDDVLCGDTNATWPAGDNGDANVVPVPEGDTFVLLCEVSYGGGWPPRLEWRNRDGDIISDDVETRDDGATVNSTLRLDVSELDGVHPDDKTYTCRLYFATAPDNLIPPDTADDQFDRSVPEYERQCRVTAGTGTLTPGMTAGLGSLLATLWLTMYSKPL